MVDAYKAWMELDKTGSGDSVKYFDTGYTGLGDGFACKDATCDKDGGAKNLADCQKECDKSAPWGYDTKTPKAALDAGNTLCVGVYHKNDNSACKLCHTKIPTKGSAAAGF